MKVVTLDIVFPLSNERLANIDLARGQSMTSAFILDLIISQFPRGEGHFQYLKSVPCGAPGFASNRLQMANGKICLNLYVPQNNTDSFRCLMMMMFLPRFAFFRPWYRSTEYDSELLNVFFEKMAATLRGRLASTNVEKFNSEEALLEKYPEFR